MAIKIQWDTVQGSEISVDASESTFTRTGLASGISTKDPVDDRALINALIAAIRSTPRQAPGTVGTWIKSLLIKPVAATDQARISVTWTGPSALPQNGVRWVIEDTTSLAQEEEELDRRGKVIQAIYTPPGQQAATQQVDPQTGYITLHSGGGLTFPPIPHTGKIPVLRPRRNLHISGYVIGPPGALVLDAIGTVNDGPWPKRSLFAGDKPKPIGYWLCSHASATTEQPRGFTNPFDPRQLVYKVSATFQSKVFRDWGSTVLWRNLKGQIPRDLGTDAEAKKRLDIINGKYSLEQKQSNGFTKVGLYFTSNFLDKFGF